MDKILDFRQIPLRQDDASVLECVNPCVLVQRLRKRILEKTKAAKSDDSKHKIFSTVIFLNEEKAVSEMQVMMLSPRMDMTGCSGQRVSNTPGICPGILEELSQSVLHFVPAEGFQQTEPSGG